MAFKASSLGLTSFGLAFLLVAAVWPITAQAQTTHPIHPIYHNARFQIGDGLPLPATAATFVGGLGGSARGNLLRGRIRPLGCSAPNFTFACNTTATLMQGTGAVPSIVLPTGHLRAPGNLENVPVFLNNSVVFQVATSFMYKVPGTAPLTFSAGGRTGPSTVAWCPGLPNPTAAYNPGCTGPGVGIPNGLIRYTKTVNQFGGAAVGAPGITAGVANIALVGAFAPPCTGAPAPPGAPNGNCLAAFANAIGTTPAALGAAFGTIAFSTPTVPNPGLFAVAVKANGEITKITTMGVGSGATNAATSFAAPWTTGMLTVSVTAVFGGPPEIFIRTGSDGRVSGVGGISLVSGAVSARTLSGPNANRGWLNLYVPEPSAALGAVGALLMLVTCHRVTRRRSR